MEDARSDSNIWFYRHKPLKALVAAITLVAFLFNTVSYDLAWAAQPMLTQTVSPSPFKALNVDTFALPGYMGTIRDSWSAPERTTHDARRATIIHIQDAHCNYYAQKKISEII